ncbi:SDR family NAD(P)-dependent oxidoreductase [Caldovatus aquaticus]|uniref:SDR family oxidoreductase n=1 Tax=Caldovatus aquaticus TaxID=2865671 RepID=A0ABS7F1H6_9PROT|nr:SDR family NAD(P)-dependent oxidoreductase [Caldovatus aquaticus]MBW8269480.1 SDR family oxidoreductase [Caldovatus aquaticus]
MAAEIGVSFRLDGQRALVTGASKGIGRAAAIAMAEAGAEVVLAARSAEALEALAAELRGRGLAARALPLDVTDAAAMREAIARAGPFDALFNNAGGNRPQPFLEVDEATFDWMFALNVRAAFMVSQAVARGMVAAGRRGAIVHMTSQMGHVGGRDRTVYCGTKHALEGMTKAMALELAPHGIRVNAVAPTFILTELTRDWAEDPAWRAEILPRIPLGRLGMPRDVAGAVVFLCSPAAAMITGHSLLVDGGWTAQ